MDPKDQAAQTPWTVLRSFRATGKIPEDRMKEIDPTGQEYYFQNDAGKICLTRLNWPEHTDTPEWRATKDNFAAAVKAWQALDQETKDLWNTDPRRRQYNLPGYQLFLKLYMKGKI